MSGRREALGALKLRAAITCSLQQKQLSLLDKDAKGCVASYPPLLGGITVLLTVAVSGGQSDSYNTHTGRYEGSFLVDSKRNDYLQTGRDKTKLA